MWSTMTVDEPRGLIYAGLGDANRPGPKARTSTRGSIVAIDAKTGKMKWFHQLIHHDIWDFDMPTPPLLVDVKRNGRVIPAVFLTGKFELVFMFNRDTGEPLYGMTERPVPRSDNPSGYSWPTQPFPDTPPPIGRVGMTRADINKTHAGDRKVLHRVLGQQQHRAVGAVFGAAEEQWTRDVPVIGRRAELGAAVVQPATRLRVRQPAQHRQLPCRRRGRSRLRR